ncbi:MAG TPA: hypothetical protein VM888_08800, partial [Chitinophagaceae bacterium]|nr:hypothetical protein [Chitinophagaceae bacterium]
MKKIFPIIIVLITLSLIGVIVIQISWLKNMLPLQEDQVYQKVWNVTTKVGDDLAQHKGVAVTPNKLIPPFGDDFTLEFS